MLEISLKNMWCGDDDAKETEEIIGFGVDDAQEPEITGLGDECVQTPWELKGLRDDDAQHPSTMKLHEMLNGTQS